MPTNTRQNNALLRVKRIPVNKLVPDPENARRHPPRNLEALGASLDEFGQVMPILVQKGSGRVIGGNATLDRMAAQGKAEVQAIEIDIDDDHAKALAIALNRTGELAEWDFETLAGQIRDLMESEFNMDALGWAPHEIEPLLEADWTPPEIAELPGLEGSGTGIALTSAQRAIVDRALGLARERSKEELTDGEAVVIICESFAGESE